jgi:hypothetical protein
VKIRSTRMPSRRKIRWLWFVRSGRHARLAASRWCPCPTILPMGGCATSAPIATPPLAQSDGAQLGRQPAKTSGAIGFGPVREAERAPSIRVDFAGRRANARPAWLRPPSPQKPPRRGNARFDARIRVRRGCSQNRSVGRSRRQVVAAALSDLVLGRQLGRSRRNAGHCSIRISRCWARSSSFCPRGTAASSGGWRAMGRRFRSCRDARNE